MWAQIVTKVPQQQAFINLPTVERHDVIISFYFSVSLTLNIQFISLNHDHSFVHSHLQANPASSLVNVTDKFNKKHYILEKKPLQFALALNKPSLPTFELLPERLEEFLYLLREHPSFSDPPPLSPIVPVQLPYFYQGCGRWIFSAGGGNSVPHSTSLVSNSATEVKHSEPI